MKYRGRVLIAVISVICICLIETAALFNGMNGKGLALAIGSIFGIVGFFFGYLLKSPFEKIKGKEE